MRPSAQTRPSAHLSIVAASRRETQRDPALPFLMRLAMALVLVVLVTLVLLAADVGFGMRLNPEPLTPATDLFGD